MAARLDAERARARRLGEVREAMFGAQVGLLSTLAVASAVSGATGEAYPVLVAGIASGLAGTLGLAAGEFLTSKGQREIALAQIALEREKVANRRGEVQGELAYMFEEDGLPDGDASQVAGVIARHPEVLLNTKVEKAFGVAIEEAAVPAWRGALIMGAAFGLGALVPLVPHAILPVGVAVFVSTAITSAMLFGIGAVKATWTRAGRVWSGLETLLIGVSIGIAGYAFGTVLPTLLGASPTV